MTTPLAEDCKPTTLVRDEVVRDEVVRDELVRDEVPPVSLKETSLSCWLSALNLSKVLARTELLPKSQSCNRL